LVSSLGFQLLVLFRLVRGLHMASFELNAGNRKPESYKSHREN